MVGICLISSCSLSGAQTNPANTDRDAVATLQNKHQVNAFVPVEPALPTLPTKTPSCAGGRVEPPRRLIPRPVLPDKKSYSRDSHVRAVRQAKLGWLQSVQTSIDRYPLATMLRLETATILSRSHAIADPWALGFYLDALVLHDAGCAIAQKHVYDLLEGAASIYGRLGEPQKALWLLERSARQWPDSARTHFKLSVLYCENGALHRCYLHLQRTLELAAQKRRPPFHEKTVSGTLSVSWYVRRARASLDLHKLWAHQPLDALLATYETVAE